MHDGVDPRGVIAAVRGTPLGRDHHPGKAFVRQADAQPGRLGDDGRVGRVRLSDRSGADTGILLIDDEGQEHIPQRAHTRVQDGRHPADHGGKASLHVIRPAPVQAIAAKHRRKGVLHPSRAHRIRVAI